MNKKPTILVTNDDSIYAPGIHALVEATSSLDADVYVVAPDKPCSGMGHAITVSSPLRISPYLEFNSNNVKEAYMCSGTPADCVKIARGVILNNQKPDLCLSGINHGSNHAINILYSGTMSAAVEASIENIPSIGFSLGDLSVGANFAASIHFGKQIIKDVLTMIKTNHFCLNVNIPKGTIEDIKGLRVCHQAYGKYEESFDEREDPNKQKYYWLKGNFMDLDPEKKEGDIAALENKYISIVPVQFDMTNYSLLQKLKSRW